MHLKSKELKEMLAPPAVRIRILAPPEMTTFIWIDSVLSSLFLVCSSLCEIPCESLQCPLILVESEYRVELDAVQDTSCRESE